jgi:hypothetical protein
LAHAAGSVAELQRTARLNEGPESACKAAQCHVRQSVDDKHVWWIGGYSIGIAMPPSWAGHTYLANDGPKRCLLREGYVSNYETILIDKDAGFEASFVDTIVMTNSGLDVLSSIPRGLLETGT